MDYFSEKIEKNKLESKEIDDWIANIRVELKKNVIRKQNRDINNREIYSYLHDIFGAEVLDLFDIEYDDPMVFNPIMQILIMQTMRIRGIDIGIYCYR